MWNSALRQSPISVFQEIVASTDKIFILEEDEALGNNFMKFWHFFDVFKFPKIPSLKSFDNSLALYPNSRQILLLPQLLLSFIFPCQHNYV